MSCGRQVHSKEDVIYGENGLDDILALKNSKWLDRFNSVPLLTEKSRLQKRWGGFSLEEKAPTKTAICYKEPLENTKNMGHCSGSLIEGDLLVTAKHCLDVVSGGCHDLAMDFDVRSRFSWPVPRLISPKNIFSCKRVYQPADPASDLIMIRLDRPTNRPGLDFVETTDWLSVGELTVLGYPLGGAQKVASGGSFREAFENDQVLAELDAFEGNSGSPVFSGDGKVRGILVGGESDFMAAEKGCLKIKRCATTQCTGETLITSRSVTELHDQIKRQERIAKLPQKVVFDRLLIEDQDIPEPSSENMSPSLKTSFKIESQSVLAGISIQFRVLHENLSDISMDLISPSGQTISLLDRVYKRSDEVLIFNFKSEEDSRFDSLIGQEIAGEWQIIVKDESELESGKILALRVEMIGANL